MFDFFSMADNYEARKVDRYDTKDLLVDTASCTDGDHEFETAVSHREYNDGKWVIVEAYDTEEDAQIGHDRWVKTMTAAELPEELIDCQNAAISKLCDNLHFPRQTKP